MTDIDRDQEEFEPGVVDENQHGWAPDAPGAGEAKDRAIQANQRAFEARDTQDASRGDGDQDPDFPPEGVGESTTRRGEDVSAAEGGEPGAEHAGTKGTSQRPYGTSGAPPSTSNDPNEDSE